MNRILVTGANGQLGSEITLLSASQKIEKKSVFFFTDYQELDITDKSAITNFVQENKINAIINCAAYTAVDSAETEMELANNVNALAPKYLAEIAKECHCKFIHISTDYVFDGKNHRPYVETDIPNPQSVYGVTKLQGEKYIQDINPNNTIIIRTSWVYSKFGNNFVKTMLKLGSEREQLNVINDQVGTPTNAKDLAIAILEILPQIKNDSVEIYHFSNEGVCSWYDFAKTIFELKEINCLVNPIPTAQYPTPAKRPSYSILNKSKIKGSFNIQIPYWRNSLKDFF
jgi:dTDP-4-dehydrorhamnose reductase